jgi:hypothetical protein
LDSPQIAATCQTSHTPVTMLYEINGLEIWLMAGKPMLVWASGD